MGKGMKEDAHGESVHDAWERQKVRYIEDTSVTLRDEFEWEALELVDHIEDEGSGHLRVKQYCQWTTMEGVT